jgi:hypothetical protein
MASTPRASIADDAVQDLRCAICGEDALSVVHVERLPDYVECAVCKSAFIMEDGGDRVLYGQIAENYPQTSQFALKQWVWIEAVDTRASEERPPKEEITPESAVDIPVDIPEQYPSEETEAEEPTGEQAAAESWGMLDASRPGDEAELGGLEAPAPELIEEAPLELDESLSSAEIASDLEDEEQLFRDLVDESYEDEEAPAGRDSTGTSPGADEDLESADEAEMPGFAWLGGLADEDTGLEEPDLGLMEEAPSDLEMEEAEAGLTSEDLDDLFKPEDEQMASEPTFEERLEESSIETAEDELGAGWLTPEPDIPQDDSEEDQVPTGWMDGLDLEEQTGEPSQISEGDDAVGVGEVEAEVDRFSLEPDRDDELMGEDLQPGGWELEEVPDEAEEAQPAFSDFDMPVGGLSIDEADSDEDFLSSLRDSAAIPLESQPLEDASIQDSELEMEEPAPPSWAIEEEELEVGAMAARMQAVTSSEHDQVADQIDDVDLSELGGEGEIEKESVREDVIHYRETDPPSGYRHRVVIGGDRVIFPGGECVHCGRTPVKGQLAIAGTLPAGQGMGDRKPARFQVPLCGECRDRATSLSEDAKSARLQSLLFALIIGMAFVVGSLAFGLVRPGSMQLTDWFILLILFIIGFAGSAILLLNRISNYPPPLDAAYVRTTLLIPSETQGLETAFEWRNEEYAQRFHEANESNALGNVTRVKDRLNLEAP